MTTRWWIVLVALVALGCGDEKPHATSLVRAISLIAEDGSLPELAPALSAEKTRQLRDNFDWKAQPRLRERDEQDRPALYYVAIYVESRAQLQALRALGVHESFVPLFEEERARWDGRAGFFTLEGDGKGVFTFAIIPGSFFNELRSAAAGGSPIFNAVVQREVPNPAAMTKDGYLDADWLLDQGFVYGGAAVTAPRDSEAGSQQSALVAQILRAAVSPFEDAIDEARSIFGEFDKFGAGSAELRVSVQPIQTDPSFEAGSPMRRAWGVPASTSKEPLIGEPLFLRNAMIQSHKGVSLFRGKLDDAGVASVTVAKGPQNVCVELSNMAAEISNFLTALVLCNFNDPVHPDENLDVQEATHLRMDVSDYRVNIFAQAQDGWDYMRWAVGRPPRQAFILTGLMADAFGEINGGRAFAMCAGDPASAFASIIEGLLPVVSTDIIFPFDRSQGSLSRGVATHEYGHFVLCDLMHATNASKFQEQWTNVTTETLFGHPDADNQTLYMNEAWADFFALQVVGGTNYLGLNGSRPASGGMSYCPGAFPASVDCADDNIGGPDGDLVSGDGYAFNIERVVSIFQDAFDGSERGELSPGLIHPQTGAFEVDARGTFARPRAASPDARDEQVDLPMTALPRFVAILFDSFATLNEPNALRSLVRLMREQGWSDRQICELLALHEPSRDCRRVTDEVDAHGIEPSTPFELRVSDRTSTQATFTWSDSSLVATGFELDMSGIDGTVRHRSLPYSRTAVFTEPRLRPDTWHIASLKTLNEGLVSALRSVDFVTLAAPVRSADASAGAGSAHLSWDAPELGITSFEVWMTEPEVRLLGRTDVETREYEVASLREGESYRFAVASANQLGEATEKISTGAVTPTAPEAVYVAVSGDDAGIGSSAAPFASVGRAVSEAAERGVTRVRVRSGRYVEGALSITSSVGIEGGELTSEGAWGAGEGEGVVLAFSTLAESLRAPTTAIFNTEHRPAQAAITVQNGARLELSDLSVEVTGGILPSGQCIAPLHADGGALSLARVKTSLRRAPGPGACAAAVLLRQDNSDSAIFTASRSELNGLDFDESLPAGVELAGIASQGARTFALQDRTTACAVKGSSMDAPSGVGALVGATLSDAEDVSVTRSFIWSSTPSLEPIASGYIGGLQVAADTNVVLDNSVLQTASGGTLNRAVDIRAIGQLERVMLLYTTAIAGRDWGLRGALPTTFDGAAVRLSGSMGSLRLFNSVFSYAAGGLSSAGAHWTGVDLSTLAPRPRLVSSHGNVFSVPTARLVYCNDTEFGMLTGETSVNLAQLYDCGNIGDRTWTASGNIVLDTLPNDLSVGRERAWIVKFDATGKVEAFQPSLQGSERRVGEAGLPPAQLPFAISESIALGGEQRSNSVSTGAGAWVPSPL